MVEAFHSEKIRILGTAAKEFASTDHHGKSNHSWVGKTTNLEESFASGSLVVKAWLYLLDASWTTATDQFLAVHT
jgi:hypothetical protein